jgi:hypothetical protein
MWTLLLALALLMPSERTVDVKVGPVQREIVRAITNPRHRFLDVEGAIRSAKTWSILIGIRRQLQEHPGITWTMARWNAGDLNQKLRPDWRNVCELMGLPPGSWNASERCYDFDNKSRLYAIHLKTQQTDNRFAHLRGLTTAGMFLNQLEEVPEDVFNESVLRLSQPGFPQQLVADPNPIPTTHYISRRFPTDNGIANHRYLHLSIWDNKHNLDPATIAAAEALFPVGHPLRRVKLEGRRGLDVSGVPIYQDAFDRDRHVRSLDLIPTLPLLESYDYGYHHPCVTWHQYAPWGWVRVLGGVMGSDLHLDAFLPIVERYRNLWFPNRSFIQATCDPAGAAANSQGLRGTPVGLLADWYREHGERDARGQFVSPQFVPDANQPERRQAAHELAVIYMGRQVNGDEAFLVDPERWVLAALGEERFDSFFLDGLEAGYVREDTPRHSNRLGTYWVAKKDGWFEHAQNTFEYYVQTFVRDVPLNVKRAAAAQVSHAKQQEKRAQEDVRRAQQDRDPDDPGRYSRSGRGRGRGGY